MKFLLVASTLGLFSPSAWASIRTGEPNAHLDDRALTLQADSLAMEPGRRKANARGEVTLDVGDLTLRTETLTLDLETGLIELPSEVLLLVGDYMLTGASGSLSLRDGSIDLAAVRLGLPDPRGPHVSGARLVCDAGSCVVHDAHGTLCPHHPVGYEVLANTVVVHPSGDVDLSRAALSIDGVKILALPWIRIRPPDKPGFLLPRLRWDREGGLVVGPAGHIPLANGAFAQGYVAARTSSGLESSSRLETKHTELIVDYLLDAPRSSARVRAKSSPPTQGGAVAMELDIAGDRAVIDDLASDPLERASSHTRSLGLFALRGDDLIVESQATFQQALFGRSRAGAPRVSIGATWAPEPSLPIRPSLELGLARFDTVGSASAFAATVNGALPAHIELLARPAIEAPLPLRPFLARLHIESLHAAWHVDGAPEARRHAHAITGGADLGFPLVGALGGLSNLLSPFVAYRATPFGEGASPGWDDDGRDVARIGHGLEAGIATSLHEDTAGAASVARLRIHERVDLPGLGDPLALAYLFVALTAGPRWLEIDLSGSVDHRRASVSHGSLALRSHDASGSGLSLGASWLGPGRGAHLDGQWVATVAPGWSRSPAVIEEDSLEISSDFRAAFNRFLAGVGGARIGVVPHPALHALWYGLELSSSCGCVSIGLVAAHRLNEPIPDVMATLSVGAL